MLLQWEPKKLYSPLTFVAEKAIMAHVESISKMWKCIPDGDLQAKTLVVLKSQNQEICGKKWRSLSKIGKGLYLSLLL